jgi:hypothetical protein
VLLQGDRAVKIFISYRRDDSAGYTGRLYDYLTPRFGDRNVFMDIDTIEPGQDFRKAIENAVGTCDVALIMIGRQWVNATDPQGERRLNDPDDWVRAEIAAALANPSVRVIPVLVRGASMPGPQELPDDLKELAWRNAIELSDQRFQYDANRLIGVIESLRVQPAKMIPGGKFGLSTAKRWIALLAVAVLTVLLASLLLPGLLERTPSPAGTSPVDNPVAPAGNTPSTAAIQQELSLIRSITISGQVASAAISPDGQVAVAGSYDGAIKFWSTYEDALLGSLNAGTTVVSLAISKDNHMLAAGLTSSAVRVWRIGGAELPLFEGLTDTVYSVAFSPDSQILAAGDSSKVVLWRVSDGTVLHTFEGYSAHITRLVFSPDGQLLASSSLDCGNPITLWHVGDEALVRKHEAACQTAVAFSPNGETLATSGVFLWRVRDGERLHELKGHTQSVESLAFSSDGQTLASVSRDVEVRRWQVSDGARLFTGKLDGADVHAVELSADGRVLMTVHRDGTLNLWQVP